MPNLFLTIGVPASGKSTLVGKLAKRFDIEVVSTDTIIEEIAAKEQTTYDKIFTREIKNATNRMYNQVRALVERKESFIWDQTNLLPSVRAVKLEMIPKSWVKTALVFPLVDKELILKRVASRPGKSIPKEVMERMFSQMTVPTYNEGFDFIRHYNNFGE